jgi:hypothetical protein
VGIDGVAMSPWIGKKTAQWVARHEFLAED